MPVNELPKFEAIKYTTTSGENCVATKNNGVVTIQGDKNGVRQMPYDEFMKSFIEDQSKKTLERTPKKDTVKFTGHYKENSVNNDLDISNGFLGLGHRKVTGKLEGHNVDFKIKQNFWGTKVKLYGTIDKKPVDLTLKKKKLEGELPDEVKELAPQLKILMQDKKTYNQNQTIWVLIINSLLIGALSGYRARI